MVWTLEAIEILRVKERMEWFRFIYRVSGKCKSLFRYCLNNFTEGLFHNFFFNLFKTKTILKYNFNAWFKLLEKLVI